MIDFDTNQTDLQEELTNALSVITTIGSDLTDSQREELIKKSYIASCAVKDFVTGELDLITFLDIQESCLIESTMDNYLSVVEENIQSWDFCELFL